MLNIKSFINSFRFFFSINNNHFEENPCSLLFPDDNILLFTNSGMIQFQYLYTSFKVPIKTKIISIQPCLRLGGKHNDLSSIGYTKYHLTFFEMLGNFSFGAYYKIQTILLIWNYLIFFLLLKKNQIYITNHINDLVTINIWVKQCFILHTNLSLLGNSDNFWSAGNIGPCGVCSEIFYSDIFLFFGKNSVLFCELWNLVFIKYNVIYQYYATCLNNSLVDTGAGFERICIFLQKRTSVFDIDIFYYLVSYIIFYCSTNNFMYSISIRIIVDHLRSMSSLIWENIIPSNLSRGYVLRRLIRRLLLLSYKILLNFNILDFLIDIYHKLNTKIFSKDYLYFKQVFYFEKHSFDKMLSNGMKKFLLYISYCNNNFIDSNICFFFYNTYGFPIDILNDIAYENNFVVDNKGFFKKILISKPQIKYKKNLFFNYSTVLKTLFFGYQNFIVFSVILFLWNSSNKNVINLNQGDQGTVILLATSFYPESGGQKSDIGYLKSSSFLFIITDTQIIDNKFILHKGIVKKGIILIKVLVKCSHNITYRNQLSSNHTMLHLIHRYCKKKDKNIKQVGSLISVHKIRCDFFFVFNELLDYIYILEDKLNINNSTLIVKNKICFIGIKRFSFLKKRKYFFDKKIFKLVLRLIVTNNIFLDLCCGTHNLVKFFFKILYITSIIILNDKTLRLNILGINYTVRFFKKNVILVRNLCSLLKIKYIFLIEDIKIKILNNIKLYEVKSILKRLWIARQEKKIFQIFLHISIFYYKQDINFLSIDDIISSYPKYIALRYLLVNNTIIISQLFKSNFFKLHFFLIKEYYLLYLNGSFVVNIFFFKFECKNIFFLKKNFFFLYEIVFDLFFVYTFYIIYII